MHKTAKEHSRSKGLRPSRARRIGLAGLLLTVCVVVAGLSAGGAAAKKVAKQAPQTVTYKFEGPAQGTPNGKATFFVIGKKIGKKFVPKTVDGAGVGPVDFQCAEGIAPGRFVNVTNDFKVKKSGSFTYKFTSFTAQITGKITNKGKKVTGTVTYGPNDTDVDTPDGSTTTFTQCVLPNQPVSFTATFKKKV